MSNPMDPQNNPQQNYGNQPNYDANGQSQAPYGQGGQAPYGQPGQDVYGQQAQGGFGQPGGAPYQGMTMENKKALPALICSFLGLLCGILSIVGIVLGVIAQKEIRESNGMQTGAEKAKLAIIVGAVVTILNLGIGIWVATQD